MRAQEAKLSQQTGYRIKIVEKNDVTFSQSLVQRDPYVGWNCKRGCGVCKWKPANNQDLNCNLQNVVYKGICLLCERNEILRLEAQNMSPEEIEDNMVVTEYIGETCKSIHIRSMKHLDDYRLLAKDGFILKHHIK